MKYAIKILVCIVTFFAALLFFSAILNRRNVSMTEEMREAGFPTVSILYEDVVLNTMEGHISRMQPAYMRESITPLSEGRSLTFFVDTYDAKVESISYEVRSVDGERLIENTPLNTFHENHGKIEATISLKDLLDTLTEYSLIFVIGLGDGTELYYYTRVIQAYEYDAGSKIRFASHFSEETFDKDTAAEDLVVYLESDSSGDNTNYANVDIHSSLDMVTWGELEVTKESDVQVTLQELAPTTATVQLEYLVSIPDGRNKDYFAVKEHYRLRQGSERMYLLDFERKMEQFFFEEQSSFYGDKIMIGIADSDMELVESDDGNQLAFVKSGSLYSCNIVNNSCSRIFSFYDEENWDYRTRNSDHNIRILNIDETGNVDFMVYGYMNRGTHEGATGISLYHYDGVKNTLEESVFIPYDKSYELLAKNVEKLSFLNHTGELFLYLEGSILKVSPVDGGYERMVEGVTDQTFKVSADHTMLVWQTGGEVYASDEMVMFDLETGIRSVVKVGKDESVLPLGFMGVDLLYGVARREDIVTDASGEVSFPMYTLHIRDKIGTLLKTYQQEGQYITGCLLEENMITLERMTKLPDGGLVLSTPDTIMNNQPVQGGKNVIEVVATEHLKKIVQIAMRNDMEEGSIKYMVPQEVLYEGGRTLDVSFPARNDRFFVYHHGEIAGVYTQPAPAIRQAYELEGVVIDDSGDYVWIRGNLATKNQIMKITGTRAGDEKTSMAVCLETILSFEGYSKNAQEMLNSGWNAMEILEESLPDCRIMDLSGCNLESVLYYVNKDIPVLAVAEDGSAVLVVGFNELNTVWMNPENGKVYKVGMNDSKSYFEENGNHFITYVPE